MGAALNLSWTWIEDPQTEDQKVVVEHLKKTSWRRVEKQVNEQWMEVLFEDLKVGDKFRSFEADGTPVADGAIYTVGREPVRVPDQPGNWILFVSQKENRK